MELLENKIEKAALKYAGIKENCDWEEERYYNRIGVRYYEAFIAGAKSPEAKAFHIQGMYTEEEVKELLECYESHFRCHISQYCDPQDVQNFEEFFEQNKKKS